MRPGPFLLALALGAAALPLAGCSALSRPDELAISAEPPRAPGKAAPAPQAPAPNAPSPAAPAPAGAAPAAGG